MDANPIRSAGQRLAARATGLVRKIAARSSGRSPVSRSCQIPGLREIYDRLGLSATAGTFVEVGGFDGESFSNTSFLADQGWRGIYVEPIPHFCATIRRRHFLNRVTVEPVAIDAAGGRKEFNLMGSLSTGSQETRQAYAGIRWAKGSVARAQTVVVDCEPLATVLARNAIPHDFELMVIDVEGAEEPIVEELLASPWRPKVLIVELIDQHADFAQYTGLVASSRNVRRRLAEHGYGEVFADAVNTVFARDAARNGPKP